ncbi:MAG: response regulator [Candidatus Hydrogenedens sp.]|nr:response regulator [Candidatus Hydrogenedens sp.]
MIRRFDAGAREWYSTQGYGVPAPMPENTTHPASMLVVDDKANVRTLLESAFVDRGYHVDTAPSGEDAVGMLGERHYDVVLSDLNMPGMSGLEVLKAAKSVSPETEVILITAYGTIDTAVEAMRLGAHDFITKPFKIAEIERKVDRIARQQRPEKSTPAQTWIHPQVKHFVAASDHSRRLLKMIARIAPSKSSVLITGPSGVGKELVARAIHEASPRRDEPFVALNCAALAPGVLESELFGHEKGAFTGADSQRIGRFERAIGGTLFLDEVGEIDNAIQTKLLRVLQENEIERVGGAKPIPVDVRIVAATNRDLKQAIEEGRFREDFYYRLNVFALQVEPLSARPDDIPALVDHFLRKFSLELGKEVLDADDDVIYLFMRYGWPGNVRELENVIERAVVLAEGNSITREELPAEILNAPAAEPTAGPTPAAIASSLQERTDRMEAELIQGALERFRWNKTKAAEHLGLKRTTLQYKIKKFGLE